MKDTQAEFSFRIWYYSEDCGEPEYEVWCDELEPMEPGKRPVTDWGKDHITILDVVDKFQLDPKKCYQIVGKGKLSAWFDSFGEWDEEFEITIFQKAEIPEDYLKERDEQIREFDL